jgi:hypothetical protein
VNGDPLSESVRTFIQQRIDSVAQLEILLLLHSRPDVLWAPDSLSTELRVSPAWTDQQIGLLARQGLVLKEGNTYRYKPDEPTRACVAELATAYSTHRMAVVGLIYSKPSRSIASLADAFRFRRNPDTGPQDPPNG